MADGDKWRGDMRTVRPMLATLEDAPLESTGLVYEPKYDGIRALVDITPGRARPFGSGRGSATTRPRSFPISSPLSPVTRES